MDMETYDPDFCPVCGSGLFEISDRNSDSRNIWINLKCNDCHQVWTEEYTLTAAWKNDEEV